ncbi:MAG: hypothetical protein JWL87_158 [Candidatus Adlerbacteria bacterium]|nr:hypothetical protein [Candidatus Adlerbacteria bacterium]
MKVEKEIRSLKALNNKIISTATAAASRLRARRYGFFKAVFLGVILTNITLLPINVSLSVSQAAVASSGVSAWWPKNDARLSGSQPFKAALDGVDPGTYEMFWQVDGGSWNWMDNSYTDAPHKESGVDVSGWNWKGAGPYKINFIARQNDTIIGQKSVDIFVENGQASVPVPPVAAVVATSSAVQAATSSAGQSQPMPSQPAQQVTVPVVSKNPLKDLTFYVNANSSAKAQAASWSQNRPDDARKMSYLAAQPTASWFGGWNQDVQSDAAQVVNAAKKEGAAPVLVAYNIPGRDCGGYSAGGSSSKDAYTKWIGAFARGIGSASAVVILEPDALAGNACLSGAGQRERADMLAAAVSILKSNSNTKVYIDAGHSGWIDAKDMAAQLEKAGIQKADGFSLNVSNFNTTSDESAYGTKVSQALGGKHFVIDTARNGNGGNSEWCNPWGRKTGQSPSAATGQSLIDAYLWVKTPGESDGACNGGPSAGTWWPEYALSLVK